jgi:hypothetical protein
MSLFRIITLVLGISSLGAAEPEDKVLLAHYMPWYATKDVSGEWGWHWTMGHFDPDQKKWDDQREIASYDYPLIGPYDSGDDQALECQVLLMKLAGLDGVIIDWYGTSKIHDHAVNHRNTQKLIPWLKKAGLKFAICYEDQAVKTLKDGEDVMQARRDLEWAQENWFGDSSYVMHEGRPVCLVFGPQHLKWKFDLKTKPVVFGLPHLAKANGLEGVFAWPPVSGGKSVSPVRWTNELELIYDRDEKLIATAFPGFKDIYKQAGVRDSYGSIAARDGKTLAESLELALKSKAPIIQMATWNDYGEGTVIEPTRNNGFRCLEALPRCGSKADLRLPVMLYQLRKRGGDVAIVHPHVEHSHRHEAGIRGLAHRGERRREEFVVGHRFDLQQACGHDLVKPSGQLRGGERLEFGGHRRHGGEGILTTGLPAEQHRLDPSNVQRNAMHRPCRAQ